MRLPHRLGGSVSSGGGFFGGPSRGHRCACCIEQRRDQRQSIGVVVNGQDVNRLLIPCRGLAPSAS